MGRASPDFRSAVTAPPPPSSTNPAKFGHIPAFTPCAGGVQPEFASVCSAPARAMSLGSPKVSDCTSGPGLRSSPGFLLCPVVMHAVSGRSAGNRRCTSRLRGFCPLGSIGTMCRTAFGMRKPWPRSPRDPGGGLGLHRQRLDSRIARFSAMAACRHGRHRPPNRPSQPVRGAPGNGSPGPEHGQTRSRAARRSNCARKSGLRRSSRRNAGKGFHEIGNRDPAVASHAPQMAPLVAAVAGVLRVRSQIGIRETIEESVTSGMNRLAGVGGARWTACGGITWRPGA